MARSNRVVRAFATAMVALQACFLLAGCGAGGNCNGGLLGGRRGGLFGGGGGLGPLAPGSGSGRVDNTPVLGGLTGGSWGQTGQNPPQMGPLAPGSGITLDGDDRAILAKYNTEIRGDNVTSERVKRITTALQLYKTRQHPLTVVIAEDPSKLPESARWVREGNVATIFVWQPELQHTINHEMAHDMTLMAYEAEGERMAQHVQQVSGEQNTWPSDYASSNIDEARAEIVSFLAAIWARVPIDEQPFGSFNPHQAVQEDARAFMSEKVVAASR